MAGREVYKLRDIMRYCRTKIKLQPVLSLGDVMSVQAEKILDRVHEIIENGDLTRMKELIESRVNEEGYTTIEMAAAFLKMAMGEGVDAEELKKE